MNADARIVSGARCTWWDSIDKAGKIPPRSGSAILSGMPCCPFCGRVLFEVASIEEWNANVERYCAQADAIPNYRALISWMRGKCFPDLDAARAAFDAT